MKQFDTGEGPIKTECPYCHEELDRSTGMSPYNPEDKKPSPGDVSVCSECGEISIFDQDMNMVKPSDEERAELIQDEHVAKTSFMIKAVKAGSDPVNRERFLNKLDSMEAQIREWRAIRPDTKPMIQYNYQKEVGLIATMADAVEKKFVTVNDDAKDMLDELGWLRPGQEMPTVNMVRVVIEHVFGEE